MKILDWYVLKKFIMTFLFVVGLFVLIIVVIDITEKMEKFTSQGLTFAQVAGFYLDYIPWLANTITPITIFIATVFVTAKMASHTEIVATLSSGVSFRRFLRPYLIGSVFIGSVSFYLIGWVIPNGTKSRVEFENKYLEQRFTFNERDNHFQEEPTEFIYVRNFTVSSSTGYNFTREVFKGNKLMSKLSANNMQWDEEREVWVLNKWLLRELESGKEIISEGDTMSLKLKLHPKDFASDKRLNEAMTIPELDAKVLDLKTRGLDGFEIYQIEKYVRIAYPFAAIILTFIGVSVSARKTRGGTGFQIAIGFVIAFVFIIYFMMSKSMAEGGSLEPMVAVWLPNITFTGIALLLYRTVPR